jgi:hypothetical protein
VSLLLSLFARTHPAGTTPSCKHRSARLHRPPTHLSVVVGMAPLAPLSPSLPALARRNQLVRDVSLPSAHRRVAAITSLPFACAGMSSAPTMV